MLPLQFSVKLFAHLLTIVPLSHTQRGEKDSQRMLLLLLLLIRPIGANSIEPGGPGSSELLVKQLHAYSIGCAGSK